MATWVEFTSYLDGSRGILAAERDELYDQLAAKLGDCSSDFSLNSSDQATITGSKMLTDLASLDDSSGPTNTIGRLHAILEAVSGAFPNYAAVVSASLSLEGMTDSQRDAILAGGFDVHNLWNYYKRVINGIECSYPPDCGFSLTNGGFSTYSLSFPICISNGGTPSPTCTPVGAFTLYQYFHAGQGTQAGLRIILDGVVFYDSSIIGPSGGLGTSQNRTHSIPAGAGEIQAEVYGVSGPNGWGYSLLCHSL